MPQNANTIDFLSYLRTLDIRLGIEEEKLVCSAPKGALTPELSAELKARRAEIIACLSLGVGKPGLRPIQAIGHGEYLPLSAGQQRLWFINQFDPTSAAYNIAEAFRFIGKLDREALKSSLEEIVRRHEVLRTRIVSVDDSPKAIVHRASWQCEIDILDRGSQDPNERVQSFVNRCAREPFNLSSDHLIRARIGVLSENEHLLVVTIHHIVCDGWSLDVFTNELSQLYLAFSERRPSPLSTLPIQYSDYVNWQREYLNNEVAPAQLAFWKQRLQGPLPVTELPFDYPRRRTMTFRGARSRQTLPQPIVEAVQRFSSAERHTNFVTLLTAFHILLLRYTQFPDIIIGTADANRIRPELEGLIGLIMNALVLRTDLSGDPIIKEVATRVRRTLLDALSNAQVSLENLIETVQPPRQPNRTPLFQIMFIYQKFPVAGAKFPGLIVERMPMEVNTTRFDVTVEVTELDDRFSLVWEYNTDLFEASTIERFQAHYSQLLECMLSRPECRLSELEEPACPTKNRSAALLGPVNDYSQKRCIHEWIEEEASLHPHTVAVEFEGERVLYGELVRRARKLAYFLKTLGVGPDIPVGIFLEPSADMVVALLGVLMAGGAYVPLAPQFPTERLRFMIEDSRTEILITDQSLADKVPSRETRIVCVDGSDQLVEPEQFDFNLLANSGIRADNLAYILYTSGSTGQPKGVEITHRSVINFLSSMQREPGITVTDRLLAVTTLSFDIAVLELLLPLVCGAQVIIAPRTAAYDGPSLIRLLTDSRATIMQATPVTWRLLLDSGWQGNSELKILVGGEQLSRELAERILKCGSEVWNLYGPTETTVWSTLQKLSSGIGSVPIGKPIDNTQIYLLDEHQNPVARGAQGEIYIGGDGLARGYVNQPELTDERFLPHPFAADGRIYRTGDLGRLMPDGALDYVGRIDSQVKLRGFRIELGEIEAVLERESYVRQAVVMLREDTPGEQHLVAYVLTRDGSKPDQQWLRKRIRETLPAHMIPSAFVWLKSFPLTPNRKIDRRALPAPEKTALLQDNARHLLDVQLLAIWSQLLDVPELGIHDNFFECGGHSLLAIKLFSQLERIYGRLPVSLLFEAPTVASMADALTDRSVVTKRWKSLVAIHPTGRRPALFVIPGVTGNVLSCTKLTNALGPDQPVYGLHALGLDGTRKPLDRMEDLAKHYVAEIQLVQPHGPYHLAGVCMGGVVAYEMARLLRFQGECVGLVAMIETWIPSALSGDQLGSLAILRPLLFGMKRVRQHLSILRAYRHKERIRYIVERIRLSKHALAKDGSNQTLRDDFVAEMVKLANENALARYKVKPYDGNLLFAVSDDNTFDPSADPQLQWAKFTTGECTVCRFAGSTAGAVKNFRGSVVRELSEHLTKALVQTNQPFELEDAELTSMPA